MAYCTESDLYDFGVPRGGVPNPGRQIVSAESNTFTLGEHGFSANDPFSLRGAGSGSLPVELSESTTYYASPLTSSTFQALDAAGGSVVTFTDAEDYSIVVVSELPVDAAIAKAEELINDMLPSHVVPIPDANVPRIVRISAAELAAYFLLSNRGGMAEPLSRVIDKTFARIERWGKGVPISDENLIPRTNIAVSPTARYTDRRGWKTYGGL